MKMKRKWKSEKNGTGGWERGSANLQGEVGWKIAGIGVLNSPGSWGFPVGTKIWLVDNNRYNEKKDTACVTHLFFPHLFPFCALSFTTFAFMPPFFTSSTTSISFIFTFLHSCLASVVELAHLQVLQGDGLAATPLNILKQALCGLYKKSGSGEMRCDGVITIRYNQEW